LREAHTRVLKRCGDEWSNKNRHWYTSPDSASTYWFDVYFAHHQIKCWLKPSALMEATAVSKLIVLVVDGYLLE